MHANWITGAALAAGLVCVVSAQQGLPVKRTEAPANGVNRPRFSSAIWAGDTLYLAGQMASPVTPADPALGKPAVFGDTKTQTLSVLNRGLHDAVSRPGARPEPRAVRDLDRREEWAQPDARLNALLFHRGGQSGHIGKPCIATLPGTCRICNGPAVVDHHERSIPARGRQFGEQTGIALNIGG
jgi:hypothetical protein